MRIEVFEQESGIHGGPEVWVRVLANEAHDWRSIEEKLGDDQRATLRALGNRKLRYYPFKPEADGDDHDYLFEDFWVWEKDR